MRPKPGQLRNHAALLPFVPPRSVDISRRCFLASHFTNCKHSKQQSSPRGRRPIPQWRHQGQHHAQRRQRARDVECWGSPFSFVTTCSALWHFSGTFWPSLRWTPAVWDQVAWPQTVHYIQRPKASLIPRWAILESQQIHRQASSVNQQPPLVGHRVPRMIHSTYHPHPIQGHRLPHPPPSVSHQPPVADHQTPSLGHQPTSVGHQLPSVDHPPKRS